MILMLAVTFFLSRHEAGFRFQEKEGIPNDWLTYQRAYPRGAIKSQAVIDGMMQARALRNNSPKMPGGWQFAGPTNIGGRLTDIEVPKDDSTVVYIGASTGGIMKSTDNCLTWESIFDAQPILTIGDIAIDPTNSNVVWAGTGEGNHQRSLGYGDGVYKSSDGGKSWKNMGLKDSRQIGKILKLTSGPRRALVVGNLANYGVGRMYQAYCEISGVSSPEIFWKRNDALAYLNEGTAPGKGIREA